MDFLGWVAPAILAYFLARGTIHFVRERRASAERDSELEKKLREEIQYLSHVPGMRETEKYENLTDVHKKLQQYNIRRSLLSLQHPKMPYIIRLCEMYGIEVPE